VSLHVTFSRRPDDDTEHARAYLATVRSGRTDGRCSPRFHLRWWSGKSLPEPTAEDVFAYLAAEAPAAHLTFDEWCAEFGFNNDSITAFRAWDACRKATLSLVRLLRSEHMTLDEFIEEWSEQ
jgi:hypothetical protein